MEVGRAGLCETARSILGSNEQYRKKSERRQLALFVNHDNVPLPAWTTICELAELWHVPPWVLEDADKDGRLLEWAVRALSWRSTKNKREERING